MKVQNFVFQSYSQSPVTHESTIYDCYGSPRPLTNLNTDISSMSFVHLQCGRHFFILGQSLHNYDVQPYAMILMATLKWLSVDSVKTVF